MKITRPEVTSNCNPTTPPVSLPVQSDGTTPDLGSDLYNRYAALLLAADDARQRLHAAQIAADPGRRSCAETAREEAIGRLQALKERVAADLYLALRLAADVDPDRLRDRLRELIGLDELEESILALADEVKALRTSGRRRTAA